jgi:hypothetical protein
MPYAFPAAWNYLHPFIAPVPNVLAMRFAQSLSYTFATPCEKHIPLRPKHSAAGR